MTMDEPVLHPVGEKLPPLLQTGEHDLCPGCGEPVAIRILLETLAELPLVAFNMARGQGDYFQSTRGGGHGDYRHIVLAPMDIGEAVEMTQLAFHLADTWRNPVLVQGDYLLAHTAEAVDVTAVDFGAVPAKD